MEKRFKNGIALSGFLFLILIIYTLCVKLVDPAPVGPEDSVVGFSSLNSAIANALPYNDFCYNISKILGLAAILIVGIFGLTGLLQVVKRKGIFKADPDIYALGIFYVLVGIVYLLFEVIVINYRPVILDEGLEASYPSSHTMLAVSVFVTAALQVKSRIEDGMMGKILVAILLLFTVIMVVTRLISGVHWFTDIVGGILFSCWLIVIYMTMLSYVDLLKSRKAKN